MAAAVRSSRPDLRLTVTGRGEADPVAPNTLGGKDNPEGRGKNRRPLGLRSSRVPPARAGDGPRATGRRRSTHTAVWAAVKSRWTKGP